MSNRYYNLGDDKQGRYDNLHGDEPEYERMASMAEAGRDVDAEIDRKQAQMDAEDAKRQQYESMLAIDFRYRLMAAIREITFLQNFMDAKSLNTRSVDMLVLQAERLQKICREMAK
jgi:uncharacterized membrane protein